jgi:ribosomal peptide maturation radical SAM protein 1
MIRLVNMPFGSLTRPSLALGLIKASLLQSGLAAQAHYLNFDFARLIGFSAYEVIALFKGVETQVSEWLFSHAAWRRPFGPTEEEFLDLCGEELTTIPHVPAPREWLRKVRRKGVPHFLEQSYQQLTATGVPRVVAFSCMFYQTVSSLALGRLIKERHPETRLVYGGACFHGEMGEELFEKAPFIDAVSTGEADDIIVPLFHSLWQGQVPRDLQGVLARDSDGTICRGPAAAPVSTQVLQAQPVPDFDDFFADAGRVGLRDAASWQERATIMFESSRGCWWGQKKHCTFCGLNGEGMEFRLKSAESVHALLRTLSARYPTRNVMASDNILAMPYFRTLLPQLADEPLQAGGQPVRLFFEVKSNLTRDQVQDLAAAGITYIQPGIESLSSSLLARIDKGVTALQNVFLLKCCTEYGLVPFWNILIRIPGECRADYEQMESWLPLLMHLRPPSGGAPRVECHRYSPYFNQPGRWAENLRPARFYRGLFPDDHVQLQRVAYYFDADWRDTLGDPAYDRLLQLVGEWMGRWRDQPVEPRLVLRPLPDGSASIVDTRGSSETAWQLTALQAQVYARAADIVSPRRVAECLQAEAGLTVGEADVRHILRELVARGLALQEQDRFLALAVSPTSPQAPQDVRRVQMRRVANQQPSAVRPRLPSLPLLTVTAVPGGDSEFPQPTQRPSR